MHGKTTFEDELEPPAELIGRYPTGFLSEVDVGWPCVIAIQVPDGGCLDTPRAIIRVSNQEVRAFETAFQIAKNARIPFYSPVSAPATAEAI